MVLDSRHNTGISPVNGGGQLRHGLHLEVTGKGHLVLGLVEFVGIFRAAQKDLSFLHGEGGELINSLLPRLAGGVVLLHAGQLLVKDLLTGGELVVVLLPRVAEFLHIFLESVLQ